MVHHNTFTSIFNIMSIQARVAFVPYQQVGWRPEPPSAASWRFLKDHCNVTGVRLQYSYDDPQWWEDALNAAVEGGMEVHGNFCVSDWTIATPATIRAAAFVWAKQYGPRMATVSAGNEPGYSFTDAFGMQQYVSNFFLPFITGVSAANPVILVGPDAESADTLQSFVNLVDVDQWLIHPYGEKEIADDGELDYATMLGENGKRGFLAVSVAGKHSKPLIISEIDHQQHKAARARGQLRGIATDEEIDLLAAFSVRMRDQFRMSVVTLGTAEYFFTRKPAPDPWSTWTHGTPVMSEVGKKLAAVFAKQQGRILGKRT
jgi:hypothetical protein